MTIQAWTNYPITELGKAICANATVIPITIRIYDQDKYASIQVDGVRTDIKSDAYTVIQAAASPYRGYQLR